MGKYRKGANAERELLQLLHREGFAVVRVAGSGASKLPAPDCLALKKDKQFAFECKAWKGNYLNISKEQMQSLLAWSDQAGMPVYIAWRIPRKGWLFLEPSAFKEGSKSYSITLNVAASKGKPLNVFIGKQKRLGIKLSKSRRT
jgi:Holliday junction resolvase